MEVVNRIFWKYGNKLFINTELVLLFRLHGNSRPDGCCSHATHIWPNCRRGDGSTCDWGWEWTVSSTAHEAYQWYNFCKSSRISLFFFFEIFLIFQKKMIFRGVRRFSGGVTIFPSSLPRCERRADAEHQTSYDRPKGEHVWLFW